MTTMWAGLLWAISGVAAPAPAGGDAAPTVPRQIDPAEPAEPTDATDPANASDASEPAEPTDATDPANASDASEPAEPSDATAPTEATDANEPAAASDTAEPVAAAAASPSPSPAPGGGPAPKWWNPDRPRFPRLVVAGGPIIGPHELGNQQCRSEDRRCITAGGFFGVGVQAEIRARIWKPLYVHGRGLFSGNTAPKKNDPIYTGIWGLGIGLGAYGRRIFARAEYMFVDAFGKSTFTPPFHSAETGKDRWGHHAGLVSVGFRQPLGERMAIELWGGPMIGPKSVRSIPPTPPERRILPTFIIGINVSVDALR